MNTTKLTPLQKDALGFLKANAGRNVTRTELKKKLFNTTRSKNYDRVVQRVIHELRMMGFAIVSNSRKAGYKLANTKQEVDEYVAEQLKRAKEARAVALKVQKAYGLRKQMRFAGVRG